jgi:hypothetical protein
LKNVLWRSIDHVVIRCSRHFPGSVPSNWLDVLAYYKTKVSWSSAPQNRQPVELTFARLVDFLQHLPANRGRRSAFVDTPPKGQQTTKAWWNPMRPPRSILDWLLVGLLGGTGVAAVVAAIALFA